MRTKKADTLYCGVDENLILTAKPELNWESVYHLKRFIIDRYKIHKRKDVKGLPAPWTKNPVLRDYRFTNVRREHDRQTKYLLENITFNPELTLEDKIVNTFMFRAWNNWDTLSLFGFPYSANRLYNSQLKENVRPIYKKTEKTESGRLWWSNAYNQGGTKAAWKFPDGDDYQRAYKESEAKKYPDWEADIPLRPFHIGPWLKRDNVVERLLASETQEECFEVIKSVRGFADFLAYQVFVDLTYIPEFPFSENEFTIAGPGCKRGIDFIFKDKAGMNYAECIFWLRNNINDGTLFTAPELAQFGDKLEWEPDKLFSDLESYDRCMNVMSLENCMCELSKYIKAVKGTGRPRNHYRGGH